MKTNKHSSTLLLHPPGNTQKNKPSSLPRASHTKLLLRLALFCFFSLSFSCFGLAQKKNLPPANDGQAASQPIPGQYIVVFKDGALTAGRNMEKLAYPQRQSIMQEEAASTLTRLNIQPKKVGHVYGTAIKGFSVSGLTEAEVEKLRRDEQVAFIEQDRLDFISIDETPKGEGVECLAQTTPWGIPRVGGGLPGTGKRAWILDTGADMDHPDLNVNQTLSTSFIPSENYPDDEDGHGTHVAGTVAAIDNAEGVIGVAAGAEIVAVKVCDSGGSCSHSAQIGGINYVAANAAAGDAANMSLGGFSGPGLSARDLAVLDASNVCPFALAAGNSAADAINYGPAHTEGPNIYTVSAMDINDKFAGFSNWGNPPVDYCAPGVAVESTWLNGGYKTIQGTSMASPHVCGLLLLGDICATTTVNNDPDGIPDPIAEHDATGTCCVLPTVSVAVSPASVAEDGATNLVYTFTRSCTTDTITVNFDIDGTLNSVNDYVQSGATTFGLTTGTISFAIGEATKTVTIDPTVDSKPEQDETMILTVTAGTGYTVGTPSSAIGTVTDDDAATISISDVSFNEGGAGTVNFCFSVSVSVMPEEGISMTATTADGAAQNAGTGAGSNDYNSKSATVNINPDFPSPQTFCVTVNGDNVVELDENFFVNLTTLNANGQDVTFADAQGEGTILNDDQCIITINGPLSADEGNSGNTGFSVDFNFSNPVDKDYGIGFSGSDGTATLADNDYIFNSNGNNSGAGVSAGFFGITGTNVQSIIGDTKVEPDETFNFILTLNSLSGRDVVFTNGNASISTPVTILNDDIDWGDAPDPTYPTLSNSNGPSHGGSNLKLGATNDGEADGQPTATADGDGTEDDGVTFTSSIIASTMATLDVTSSGPGRLEAWMDFNQNGNFNDPGENFINNDAVAAGVNSFSFMVPATATQGTTFARFRLFDSSNEGGLDPTGHTSEGEVEDYQVNIVSTEFSIDDPMVDEGDAGTANLTFTVTRSNTAGASSVNYSITGGTATSGDDYMALAAGTVNFTAGGSSTQAVTVQVSGDKIVELDETVVMTLDTPVNGIITDGEGTGTINNDDAAVITMSSPFITEGDAGSSILTFNVNIDKTVDVPVSFDYATSDGTATLGDNDYQAASGSSSIAVGIPVVYLQVSENGDCQIESDEVFNMTLNALSAGGRAVTFAGGGGDLMSTGTINNDDALPEIFIPAEFTEGTDPGQCNAAVTVPLASTASICGSQILEFRYRQVLPAPVGAWSAWLPSANNTQTFDQGRHEVEWRVTDDSGSSVGNFFFNVVDDEAPMVNCKAATAQLDTDGNASIVPADVYDGGNDNCSAVSLVSVSPNMFTCANLGDNTVTLTVQDANGIPATCTATVTVADGISPTAVCKTITVQLDGDGNASITPAQVDGGSSDNCSFSLSLDDSDFNCSDIPSTTVNLTATDGTNSHTCTATVNVEDNVKPVVTCLGDEARTTSDDGILGDCLFTDFVGLYQIDDNCSNPLTVHEYFVFENGDIVKDETFPLAVGEWSPYEEYPVGVTTANITATDEYGNSASCSYTITVTDDEDPVAACQGLTISLDDQGQATVQPDELFVADNSSDNCGTVNPASLSQSDFTCEDVGDNTITLTVNDGNGNTATCEATVTVNVFIEILGVTSTDETCPSAGDGTISISATAPYGQIGYSVDGGATWQYTGEFEFLSPGTYEIMVKLFGLPSNCVETATVSIGTDQSGVKTWYKDWDNDGYSDGVTLEQCQQPTGYKLAMDLIATSGDCNDYDANEYPGQTWWLDFDGDGYTDGTSIVQCSQPANYVMDAQPGDCDDSDAAVNPGATEICNGIDDDCDGETDEDGGGGQTFVGNVLLANQQEVDDFSQCYSIIDGNLTIKNSGVNDLSNLINLVEVTGYVYIKSTSLTSMAGLDNLTTIGNYLKVQLNNSLTTLNGLEGVTSVGGKLYVYFNNILTDCCAIYDLMENGGVGGSIIIFRNDTGCDSVSEVEDDCSGNDPLIAPPTCSDCGVSVADGQGLQFDVFPNPAYNEINIRLRNAPETDGMVTLFNSLGQTVDQQDLAAGQMSLRIDLDGKTIGEYFVRVSTEKGTEMKKVMVVR